MIPTGPYKPRETEERILKAWLEAKIYSPEYAEKLGAKETYTIIMPPPNANGDLHLGHVSGYAFQDLMGRYQRMQGKKVLLLPGKDHAGIQTEVVFENILAEQGISKPSLGREEFYKQTYEFCMNASENARNQEKRIGVSADFNRELFTLDPKVVKEVLKTFEMMYEDGLIYRGKRIINWSPMAQSALADVDTEYVDSTATFIYFKYAFLNPNQDALNIKKEFEGKTISWTFERESLKNGSGKLPFAFGKIDNLEIIGIGYKDIEPNSTIEGEVIGIQMRLGMSQRLVVKKVGYEDHKVKDKLKKIFEFEIKHYAGAHIILFNDYPEDHFYTDGFVIGTVRPETIFGDSAIAVDPKDERYKDYVGKKFKLKSILGEVELPIIADNAVDMEFGAGMLKVTPAHAVEDWEISERNPEKCLPEKQVIGFDGKLNHLTGKYEGMTVLEAREKLIEDMVESGMAVNVNNNYKNRTQIDERTKGVIEPLISYQWFVDTRKLKEKARQFIDDEITKIHPEGQQRRFVQWMNTEEDWCITRQLWWGYRIPVWYKGEKSQFVDKEGIVRETVDGKVVNSMADYKEMITVSQENPGEGWFQDEDVLDTWFSSGQWPFVTLKANQGDLEEFYPSQTMETGWDILIFWVTRMMMLSSYRAEKEGIKLENQAPFKNVYLHGLILGKDGKKMSKSRGNGIDPTKTIEDYGADALRMSIFVDSVAGMNTKLYEEKIQSFGRFLNKVWNASKFVMMNIEGVNPDELLGFKDNLNIESNKNMINHVEKLKEDSSRLIESFQFGVAAKILYNKFWHEFADVHIEAAKVHLYEMKDKETGAVKSSATVEERQETQLALLYTLQEYVKMLHPFIPFITQEAWNHLPKHSDQSQELMYERW